MSEGAAPTTPAQRRAGLQAVAVDTNAFSKGRLDLERLADWAQALAGIGLQLWLPEPVVWELADHATQEYLAAQVQFRSSRRWIAKAGFVMPEWPDVEPDVLIEDCLAEIESAHSNVHIIRLVHEDAYEALRDQVLLRPPAKRTNATEKDIGVKTGASDIAAVRSLRRHAVDATTYAVLGGDDDWVGAYEANGWPSPRFYEGWRALRKDLFTVVSAVGEGPAVLSYLASFGLDRVPSLLGPVMAGGALYDTDDEDGVTVRSVEVEAVTAIAGVAQLETLQETHQITCLVFFIADLGVTVQRYDEASGGWRTEFDVYRDALLRGNVTFDVKEDILVRAVAGADDPFRVLGGNRYLEPWEAFEEAVEALSCVPGLDELQGGFFHEHPDGAWEGEVNGLPVAIRVDGTIHDEWVLIVGLGSEGEQSFALRCQYDDEAWVGGSDGMFMEPPWVLIGDGNMRHPDWALAADLIIKSGMLC